MQRTIKGSFKRNAACPGGFDLPGGCIFYLVYPSDTRHECCRSNLSCYSCISVMRAAASRSRLMTSFLDLFDCADIASICSRSSLFSLTEIIQ